MQTQRSPPNQRPRRVLMDLQTWKSLSPQDQATWDRLSKDGKKKVLYYAANKSTQDRRATNRPPSQFSRTAKTHQEPPVVETVDEDEDDESMPQPPL